jgi:hypothetical protein
VHQRLVDERADAERRAQLGAVGERHLLGGVVGVEAVQGLPRRHARQEPQTARQLRTTKSPGAHVGDAVADRLDDARRLVPSRNGNSSLMPPSR